MELILKRGTEYTPTIFQHSDLQKLKYCKLEGEFYDRIPLETIMNFPLVGERKDIWRLSSERLQSSWLYYFISGIVQSVNKVNSIVVILVTKNDNPQDKYVIIQEEFFKDHTTYLTKLKKYINESGISSRTKLLIWSKSKIYSEFQELLNVSMEDYSSEVQKQLSSEFILAQRGIKNINKGASSEFSKGSYVIILDNMHGGKFSIDSIGIIERIDRDQLLNYLVSQEERDDKWWYEGFKDIRLATQQEIDDYLGLSQPEFEEIEYIDEIDEEDLSIPIAADNNAEDLPT